MSKKEDQIDDKSEDVVEESQEEQQNDSDLNNLSGLEWINLFITLQ